MKPDPTYSGEECKTFKLVQSWNFEAQKIMD
jgi:hypothetical protein